MVKINLDISGQYDEKDLDRIIDVIDGKECAVFIGSGISANIGYPSLPRLLNIMARETDIIELHNKIISNDWMDDFQRIKTALGTRHYEESLIRIFNHERRNARFCDIHLTLLKIPFCSYVTTNYDPCLEFAHRDANLFNPCTSFTQPNLNSSDLKGEHIFHIHGYLNPNNHSTVNSIVLSRDDYDLAYKICVSTFLDTLFRELDVIFIGFGWDDLILLATLTKVKLDRKTREEVATQKNFTLAQERKMFAIIDRTTYEKDKADKNYIKRFGVQPFIYQTPEDSHYVLNDMLQFIQKKTSPFSSAPMPSTQKGILDAGDYHG